MGLQIRHRRRPTGHIATDPHASSPTLMLVVLMAVAGALLYARFILDPHNAGSLLPYLLVVLAESFIVAQALVALWTILAGGYEARGYDYYSAQEQLFSPFGSKHITAILDHAGVGRPDAHPLYINKRQVSIDAFVTVYGEPVAIVRATAAAARDMIGRHQTYILDDGGSDEIRDLAKQLRVNYIRRSGKEGAKAGNINHALSLTRGEYFVIFDADFVAEPSFLYETMPFFTDDNIAFVQTPQFYRNLNTVISRGAGYMQRLFYRLIMPGKNRFNAAFCVGTNVVFRRTAIEEIGGVYQKSKSEDIWTSILLHERGYRSVFIPDILAVGRTPDTIKAYTKQQLRWATGGLEILLKHNPITKRLTIDQKLQYLSTATYYLYGMATAMLLLLPPLHIFFNLTPVDLSITLGAWLFYYLAFYALQVVVAFYMMEGFRPETLMLAMVSFPIYVRALINVVLRREETWYATGKRDIDSPYNYIVPQILIFLFLLFSSVVGVMKGLYLGSFSIALFWNVVNTGVFGSFLYIARLEHRQIKRNRERVGQPDRSVLHAGVQAT